MATETERDTAKSEVDFEQVMLKLQLSVAAFSLLTSHLDTLVLQSALPSEPRPLSQLHTGKLATLASDRACFANAEGKVECGSLELKTLLVRLTSHVDGHSSHTLKTTFDATRDLIKQRFIHVCYPECYKDGNTRGILPVRQGNRPTNEEIGEKIGKEKVKFTDVMATAKAFGKAGEVRELQASTTILLLQLPPPPL